MSSARKTRPEKVPGRWSRMANNAADQDCDLEQSVYNLILESPRSIDALAALTGENRFTLNRIIRRLLKFSDANIITERRVRYYGVKGDKK